MTRVSRARAERRGRVAECIAALYLTFKGYRVVGWRVRTAAGEIDLIVTRGSATAFVEVKSRRMVEGGLSAVDRQKGRRIVRAARIWMGQYAKPHISYRFDILIVSAYHWPKHLPNAFGLELW